MSKRIKDIEISFENLEYIKIPDNYFLDFSMENVQNVIYRAAANAILQYQSVGNVYFILKNDANKDYIKFDKDFYDEEKNLFERIIQYKDITDITLIYDDNSLEEFTVQWEDENNRDDRNKLQVAYLTEDGNLYLQIKGIQLESRCSYK